MKDEAVAKLEAELDRILAKLVEETHGSRSTLRFDDPARGWDVGLPCAEAVKPGVKSMRKDASINQRAGNPVKWMEKHRKTLVQPDIINSPDPAPPPALMSAYGAKAQMLSPVFNKTGFLQGWISIHYVDDTHNFTDAEVAAIERAVAEVKRLTGV